MAKINCKKAKDGRFPDIRLTTRRSLRWPRTGKNNARDYQWQLRTTYAYANREKKLRIASINVGTMKGRADEIAETLEKRRVDICCLAMVLNWWKVNQKDSACTGLKEMLKDKEE